MAPGVSGSRSWAVQFFFPCKDWDVLFVTAQLLVLPQEGFAARCEYVASSRHSQKKKMTTTLCCDHAQVAVEVHDIDFRLSRIQTLLQRHGSACVVFWQKKCRFSSFPPALSVSPPTLPKSKILHGQLGACIHTQRERHRDTETPTHRHTRVVHRLTTVGYCVVERLRVSGLHRTAGDQVAHGHVGVYTQGPQPSLRLCFAATVKQDLREGERERARALLGTFQNGGSRT